MVFIISVQRIVFMRMFVNVVKGGECLCSFITEVIHNESPFTTAQ